MTWAEGSRRMDSPAQGRAGSPLAFDAGQDVAANADECPALEVVVAQHRAGLGLMTAVRIKAVWVFGYE